MTKEELIKMISTDEGFESYLNSVRAEGVEQWLASREPKWNGTTEDAKRFAAQLRAGEPS